MDSINEAKIPTGSVLGLELEGLDVAKYSLLTQLIELSIGTRFNSWTIAEHYLKEFRKQRKFVVKRYWVEYCNHTALLNLTDRIVKRRTFTCEYARKYKPIKSKLIEQQHNKGSKKVDCKWYINLSKPEDSDFVHITFVHFEHNHEIYTDNIKFAITFQRFNQFIMDEIEHAVVYEHYDAFTIRNLLQPLFPNQLFLTQDLSNAIQKIKCEKKLLD